MNTTAETFVGASDNIEGLGVFKWLGFRILENGVGCLAIGPRYGHGPLSLVETSRGDDFHGLGDLLDILDGLQTTLDLTKGGEVGGIGGGRPWGNMSQYLFAASTIRVLQRLSHSRFEAGEKKNDCGYDDAYRATTALPALRAGRAVRENISKKVKPH